MALEKKTIKIDEKIHEELKEMFGFRTFDELFRKLLDFKREHKKAWEEFIKKK